jgi:hypothetical protein
MQFIAELIARCLLGVVWWLLLFPVVWLLSAPFILVLALFSRQRYAIAVREMLLSVHFFWKEWGCMFT